MKDLDPNTLSACLNAMTQTQMGMYTLITIVGFDIYRYVSNNHIHKWSVLPQKSFRQARLWMGIDGAETQLVVRACMEAVLSQILFHPGITEVSN